MEVHAYLLSVYRIRRTRNAYLQSVDGVVKPEVKGPMTKFFSDGHAGVALEPPIPVIGHGHVHVT